MITTYISQLMDPEDNDSDETYPLNIEWPSFSAWCGCLDIAS